jgi:putative FmdB family regulatory protein
MPIYEYACEKCGHEFEREQRITDDPVKTCPECRSRKVKKLISQTSFVLKGGGWYSDLYSSSGGKDEKPDKADESKPADTPGDAAAAKKDDKPKKADKDKPSGKGKEKGKGKKGSKAAA